MVFDRLDPAIVNDADPLCLRSRLEDKPYLPGLGAL
jgi:hypothetical protein